MHEIQDKDLINKKRIDQNAKKRKEKSIKMTLRIYLEFI